MIRAYIVTWAVGIVIALGLYQYAYAAPIDELITGYQSGTWQADDQDYAALYEQTTARTLTLHAITEQEGRTAAIYELSYTHAGGDYTETGVLVLYHDPVKLEFVVVDDLDPTAIDLAVAGQAADIGTTALALSAGLAEGNPVVAGAIGSPAGAAALIALKLVGPSLADNLPLADCAEMRTALATFGWGAATWNAALLAGASTGAGAAVAIIGGWFAADAAKGDSPLRCAGIEK